MINRKFIAGVVLATGFLAGCANTAQPVSPEVSNQPGNQSPAVNENTSTSTVSSSTNPSNNFKNIPTQEPDLKAAGQVTTQGVTNPQLAEPEVKSTAVMQEGDQPK